MLSENDYPIFLTNIMKTIITTGLMSVILSSPAWGTEKKRPNDRVNQYIDETYSSIESSKDAHPLIGVPVTPPKKNLLRKDPTTPSTETYGVDLQEENPHKSKKGSLETPSTPNRSTMPEEYVEQRIQDTNSALEDEARAREARKEYVRQVRENMEKDGYTVEINSDYVITGIKKNRRPANSRGSRTPQSIETPKSEKGSR